MNLKGRLPIGISPCISSKTSLELLMMTLCIEGVTMTTKQLIISSFTQFKELKNARKTPFAKSVLYLLVLSIIMALPISYQVFQVLENIKQDGQKIATKIPDFSIKNGKIDAADHEGFIYQTNSIIFTFDPERQTI